jgi:hypothetical protein
LVIAVFGLFFLLTYGLIMLIFFDNPYAQGLVNARLDLSAIALLLMVAFGVLMLLGVFRQWAFHALAGLVLAYRLYALCLAAARMMSYEGLFGVDIFGGGNLITFWLSSSLSFDASVYLLVSVALDLVFWCAPFVVYYSLILIRSFRDPARRSA